jgi:ParB-like chromosome segregation protein Spo0J
MRARYIPGAATSLASLNSILPADSPRLEGLDAAHVRVLAEIPSNRLPPILVHRPTFRIIDGMHRYQAAIVRGEDTIRARFVDCSAEKAFLLAVEANTDHGLPLSLADRTAVATRILATYPQWSDRAVASVSGLAGKTVGAIRQRSNENSPQSNRRVGQDGRIRPAEGGEGRRRAAEVIASRPDASLREIAREADVSLGTASDVRKRINQGEDPVTRKQRAAGEQRRSSPPERSGSSHESVNERSTVVTWPSIRQKISRDPAVRYAQPGRSLLGWMDVHTIDLERWSDVIDIIPSHWSSVIASLARSCSDEWRQLATELEQRAGPDG